MKFIDEVSIKVISGNGGNGMVHFRREKYVPYGGPDGGTGGTGGSIYVIGDEGINTLMHFRGQKLYKADDGARGHKSQSDGITGEDKVLRVPIGTLVIDEETGRVLCDITKHKEKILIAQGGRGGLGNSSFKTATNQVPEHAQEGQAGVEINVKLELKLIADIALIGLPNAGKSTLISSISNSKPKIADYPFTTITPNLGVVKIDEENSIVVADIPGLIEKASEGKGLGIQFLKHIERTKALVHLIDCSMLLEPYEALENYATIREELKNYSEDMTYKPEIVCLTKIDAMSEEEIKNFQVSMEEALDRKVLPISSVSGLNLDLLKRLMLKTKETNNEASQKEN